ncbi:MAG: non-homologous end-joining DNA ligase [Actinomycetes bacterium]
MLASPGALPIRDADGAWAYEVKWDGMRAIAQVVRGRVRLTSRSEMDVTARFREIAEAPALVDLPEGTCIDGEIVAFDAQGRPSFSLLAPRIQGHRTGVVAVSYVVFDILAAGDFTLLDVPYAARREQLSDVVSTSPFVVVPDAFDDGPSLLATTAAQGLEGVVAKRVTSTYQPGVRSADWVKVPHRSCHSYVIGGWKHGAARDHAVASLLVGTPTADGLLVFDGAVGSGLGEREVRALLPVLTEIRRDERPFHWASSLPAEDTVSWVDPVLVVDVEHLGRTGGAMLRQPSVVRLRPDLSYDSVWQEGGA